MSVYHHDRPCRTPELSASGSIGNWPLPATVYMRVYRNAQGPYDKLYYSSRNEKLAWSFPVFRIRIKPKALPKAQQEVWS